MFRNFFKSSICNYPDTFFFHENKANKLRKSKMIKSSEVAKKYIYFRLHEEFDDNKACKYRKAYDEAFQIHQIQLPFLVEIFFQGLPLSALLLVQTDQMETSSG